MLSGLAEGWVEEEPGEIVEPAEQRRPEERAEGHFDAIPRGIVQIGTVLAALALSGAGATAFCLLPSYPSREREYLPCPGLCPGLG